MVGKALISIVSGLALAGCSVVGVRDGTEEPSYSVTNHVGDIEIRTYGPRLAAETTIAADEYEARSAGFRKVAGYIFGANKTNDKIAMTAPVAQAPDSGSSQTIAMTAPVSQRQDAQGSWVIRFFMPSKYTMATLPTPTDPSVRLVEVPPETYAVLRFTGSTGTEKIQTERAALLSGLQASSWKPTGTPVAWFYDPPWTIPFLRRNEVAVAVEKAPGNTP